MVVLYPSTAEVSIFAGCIDKDQLGLVPNALFNDSRSRPALAATSGPNNRAMATKETFRFNGDIAVLCSVNRSEIQNHCFTVVNGTFHQSRQECNESMWGGIN